MKKKTIFWLKFYMPGSFFGNDYTRDVNELPDPDNIEWPENAHAVSMHKREDIIDGATSYTGPSEQVGPIYYHPDSVVTSLKQVERGEAPGEIGRSLASNMRTNRWTEVIWTRWGNWPQPYDPETIRVCRRATK